MGHLVLMAKAPRMGRVKTRLGREIGQVSAWNFYRFNLIRTTRALYDKRWNCWLSLSPDTEISKHSIYPRGWKRIKQGSGDLGARMLSPMCTLPPGPVVIIGSDVPNITKAHINAAFQTLGANNMALGPAMDGGYWLIGQRRRPNIINPFKNVRFSSEHALDDTLGGALAGPRRVRISLIDTLGDVDNKKDYLKWKNKN